MGQVSAALDFEVEGETVFRRQLDALDVRCKDVSCVAVAVEAVMVSSHMHVSATHACAVSSSVLTPGVTQYSTCTSCSALAQS